MKTRLSAITALSLMLAFASAHAADNLNPSPDASSPAPKPPEIVTNAFQPAVLPIAQPAISRPQNALAAAVTTPGAPAPKSAWLTELVKLGRSGVDESVLLSYVDSAGTFNLGAEQIIYLRDLGFSNDLITAMLVHDSEIISGQREVGVSSIGLSQRALAVKLSAPEPPVQKTSISESIVAPMEPDFLEEAWLQGLADESAAYPSSAIDNLYPVRKPYAVPVTKPLVLINTAGRTPNLVLVEMSP